MLNDYFCMVVEKLIGFVDEIQLLYVYSSEIVNMLIIISIQISQKEIEEMICKLKVKKVMGLDGVLVRFLKLVGKFIVLFFMSVFWYSVEICKLLDQWKIVRVSVVFKKGCEEDRICYRLLFMFSILSKLMELCVVSIIINYVVM